MPLISFTCNVCGESFETFQRLRDVLDASPVCPKCRQKDTKAADDMLEDRACGIEDRRAAVT
jgi:putative FmdB family regulatory protein